jgi:hypothetical protein
MSVWQVMQTVTLLYMYFKEPVDDDNAMSMVVDGNLVCVCNLRNICCH